MTDVAMPQCTGFNTHTGPTTLCRLSAHQGTAEHERGALQVPGDMEIWAAAMKRDRKARLAVPEPPSTFEADVASTPVCSRLSLAGSYPDALLT